MAEMAPRFMKTFAEPLVTDPELVGSVNPETRVTTPFGRFAVQVSYGTDRYISITPNAQPPLLSAGASALYFGFSSNQISGGSYTIRGGGQSTPSMVDFDTSAGPTVINGKNISVGWHWVENRIVRVASPLAYAWETRVDGELIWSGGLTNTQGNGLWTATALSYVCHCHRNHARLVDFVTWDDVDNGDAFKSWMGPMQVDILPAAGNGSKSEWLGSDGNQVDNYLLVDEVPAATADYVESSTDGQRDLYKIGGLAEGLTPLGVRTKFYANKEGSGLRSIKPVLLQNNGVDPASVIVDAEQSLGLSPIFVTTPARGKSPLRNAPWNRTDLTQLEFGVESSTPAP